ncbi:kinase-like domain-containing protein [Dendryphion nanum]|uniref:Kinase-like domain-containing protein n=1 Tax=Dendryphion nanum TaxID=256645 RepID=A0A9P9EKJ4_9PLEO|nr:kinase-like domain-containing protein [Dendryphion nanum]
MTTNEDVLETRRQEWLQYLASSPTQIEVPRLWMQQFPDLADIQQIAGILLPIDIWNDKERFSLSWKLLEKFSSQGITDLWLPIPRQTLKYLIRDPVIEKEIANAQEAILDTEWPNLPIDGAPHLSLEDGEDVFPPGKILGEGGFSIVDQTTLAKNGTLCARKKIGRTKQFKAQKQVIDGFRREIEIMKQIVHHHCVRLVASYTDPDTLAILCTPVADTDLAAFLDLEVLNREQSELLYRGFGCLTSALCYIHSKNIRHKDMKPQNILIHGDNLLLTDFGFSLDFSDDSVSTTTGRPSNWTARYAAPETLQHESRSRSADIWGLGCILFEMISRLLGFRLSEIKAFWKRTGDGHPSFALNDEARESWYNQLVNNGTIADKKLLPLLSIIDLMLSINRSFRPSGEIIMTKFRDLDFFFPRESKLVRDCCQGQQLAIDGSWYLQNWSSRHLPVGYRFFEALTIGSRVFADVDLRIFSKSSFWKGSTNFQSLTDFFLDPQMLINACAKLNPISNPTGELFRNISDGKRHAELNLFLNSLMCMAYINLPFDTHHIRPLANVLPKSCRVHLVFASVCLPNSPYTGSSFYAMSWTEQSSGDWLGDVADHRNSFRNVSSSPMAQ